MKRILSYLGILLIGILIGYAVSLIIKPDHKLKIVKTHTVDTLIKSKIIEVPVEIETKIKEVDTIYIHRDTNKVEDSIIVNVVEEDSISLDSANVVTIVEDEPILRDRKIYQTKVEIIVIEPSEKDTLLEKLLNVETIENKSMTIEFWESPVNYSGYKLSKSTLVIYGEEPDESLSLYRFKNMYYFQLDGLYYELQETSVYKKYYEISKPTIIND